MRGQRSNTLYQPNPPHQAESQSGLKIPRMLTIPETVREFHLPEHFVRQLCRENRIVHVMAGKKILVNADRLIDYLNGGGVV